jgi:hypothetical protein
MDDHIKTVGYLLKNYNEHQCYDQYVSLNWLKEQLTLLDIKLSSASHRAIPLSVDGKKEMHRGFLTYNEVDDMIRELKTLLEG